MFSVMMMPMSATSPMAMASPASDMMLLSTPKRYIRRKETATRQRQRRQHGHRRAQVQQEDRPRRGREHRLLGQGLLQRVDGLVDDGRAVVEGDDADLGDAAVGERLAGQAGLELRRSSP